jgi:hypothetical protein
MSAIDAYFVSFNTSRDGSTLRLVFELPTERTAQVMKVLGPPNKDGENWCAIAKLAQDEPQSQPEAPAEGATAPKTIKQAWSSLKLAARAGIICNDPAFWTWILKRETRYTILVSEMTAEHAADWLRIRTAVTSRAEYDTNEAAGRRYLEIERAFLSDKATAGRYGDGP